MATSDDLTNSEHRWLVKQGFNPDTARWMFWKKTLKARREFDGELPPGVTEERRRIDLLKMAEQIERIDSNAADIKNSFSDFWSGIGQMFASRNSRKKK